MAAQAAKRAIGPLAAIIGLAWGKEGRANTVILKNVPKKVGVEPPDFLSDPDKAIILSFIDYGYNTKRGFGGEFLVSTAMSKLEKQLSNPEKIAEMRAFSEQFSKSQQEELKNFILELGLSEAYTDKVFNDLSSVELPSISSEQMLENARKKTLPELQVLINNMKSANSPEEQAIIKAAQEKAKKQQNNENSRAQKQNNGKAKAEPSKSFSLFDPSSWGLVFASSVGLSSNTSSKNSLNNSRNNRTSWTNMTQNEQNKQVNKWGNATSETAQAEIAAAQANAEAAANSENNNNNIGPSGNKSGFGANFGGHRKTRRARKHRRRSTRRKQ